MTRTMMRVAAAAMALAAFQAHAAPATTQVEFSGVVTSVSGPAGTLAAGETISGSFTVTADPAYSGTVLTPGQSSDTESGNIGTSPLLVTGSAVFQDGSVLSLSSSPDSQRFFERLVRDGQSNAIDLLAQTHAGRDDAFLRVMLDQSQVDCAVHCVFADPGGGLSLYQSLDISAPGAQANGFFGGTTAFGGYFGEFELTSLSITAVPVPEPANALVMLAGVGLLGAMARRRRA